MRIVSLETSGATSVATTVEQGAVGSLPALAPGRVVVGAPGETGTVIASTTTTITTPEGQRDVRTTTIDAGEALAVAIRSGLSAVALVEV
jgi:hypothetical protein